MSDQPPKQESSLYDSERTDKVRFEATIHPGDKAPPDWMDHLKVDRVPDPKGQLRALLTADDCVRILELGFEIHLHYAHHLRPFNPALIATDESVARWLKEELQGINQPTDPKGPTGSKGT